MRRSAAVPMSNQCKVLWIIVYEVMQAQLKQQNGFEIWFPHVTISSYVSG